MFRIFHGKVMLFGEFAVIAGSPAVLIPYPKVNARLSFPSQKLNSEAIQSNQALQSLTSHINKNSSIHDLLDRQSLNKDIEAGLYMESSIPQNKGLGSSGAVCAAVFDAYRINKYANISLGILRTILAGIESCFHGSSSGSDPLCIYLNEPVMIHNENFVLPGIDGASNENKLRPFLLDTGTASHTAPMVRHFNDLLKDQEYAGKFTQQYIPLVEQAVKQWINGYLQKEILAELSKAQLEFFDAMIPVGVRNIWQYGISEKLYILKLCGSGGGGMILGFTNDAGATAQYIREKSGMEMLLI